MMEKAVHKITFNENASVKTTLYEFYLRFFFSFLLFPSVGPNLSPAAKNRDESGPRYPPISKCISSTDSHSRPFLEQKKKTKAF